MRKTTIIVLAGLAGLALLAAAAAADCPGPGPRAGMGRPGAGKRMNVLDQAQELGLTAEQQEAIRALQQETAGKIEPLREQVRARVQELRQESGAPAGPPAERPVFRDDPKLQELRAQIHDIMTAHKDRVKEILTDEQEAKLREMLSQRREERRGGWHGGRSDVPAQPAAGAETEEP